MKAIDRTLVIMDKPKHAQSAFQRALALQKPLATHLHLTSFAHHPMVDQVDTFETHQRGQIKASMVKERKEWLRSQVQDAGAAFEDLTLEVAWTKQIGSWVTERAKSERYDLVIKSMHRTRTVLHTPTDWDLLRHCPSPLLLVGKRRWTRKPVILATLDLNRTDAAHERLNRKVLDAANRLASACGGVVHCVYAIEISEVLGDLDIIDPRKAAAKVKARISDHLKALVERYDIPGARVHLPTGKVGKVVNGIARKVKAEVLVMGTTARKGVKGFVIGNSAERVLAKAPCDILALKP